MSNVECPLKFLLTMVTCALSLTKSLKISHTLSIYHFGHFQNKKEEALTHFCPLRKQKTRELGLHFILPLHPMPPLFLTTHTHRPHTPLFSLSSISLLYH